MAILLFITPQELTDTTIIGGNVDIDKYKMNIENVMITVIEPLLGSELYDKIISDITGHSLTGKYEKLYNDFIKPITKNQAVSEYITVSGFMISNGGAYKHLPNNSELMDKDEKALLSQIYSSKADVYIGRFHKWIGLNPLSEYKITQDDVNANQSINLVGGWYFGDGM